MSFVARSVISSNGSNAAWVGKYTDVTDPNLVFYQWDGLHRAKYFGTAVLALAAADECHGPLFQLPDPTTVIALEMAAY